MICCLPPLIRRTSNPLCVLMFATICVASLASIANSQDATPSQQAQRLLEQSGVKGGLVVHVGCGDGRLTEALRANDRYMVQGVDTNSADIAVAREYVEAQDMYGPVSITRFDGKRLPYIDNFANLVVISESAEPSQSLVDEALRVTCPDGVVVIETNDGWTTVRKPVPDTIDEWSHYLHDPTNNAVAKDREIAPPRRYQWVGGPRYARHHDNMSSFSAAVTAGGRFFYIFDEAPAASIEVPSDWKLIARDAFNGSILWKQPISNWHSRFWPLKSGPAQLPRRVVASRDRVYATLGYDAPLSCLDAATGEIIKTYDGTRTTDEVLLDDGTLYLLVDPDQESPGGWDTDKPTVSEIKGQANRVPWGEHPRMIMALDAESGELLWTKTTTIMPLSLTVDRGRVYYHDGECVVGLAKADGEELWKSAPVSRRSKLESFFAPTMVVSDGVVLFSGGSVQSNEKRTGGGDNPLFAISADNGETLWTAHHPASGYKSPEDVFVIDGTVWFGATIGAHVDGAFTGYDLHTGELKKRFLPDVETYWFHHRCYRGKATEDYLLMSRTGIEFIDPKAETWTINHWVRGACLYGILPANGLIYAPQHPCACYLETKLDGLNALAPASSNYEVPTNVPGEARLQRGPAYDAPTVADAAPSDWPTHRHDAARSGHASTSISAEIAPKWTTELGGDLTAPVIAAGQVYVAQKNQHTLWALDQKTGGKLWSFKAGARIDSPPTIYKNRVLFGSADGYVYAVEPKTGELCWRFLAAPDDRRMMYFEQIESLWPVHGNVLVEDGVLYCVAGRSMFLDGGMRFIKLDPVSGELLGERIYDDMNPETGENLQDTVDWLNMATGMSDILASDGANLYMRSLPLDKSGKRLRVDYDDLTQSEGPDAHLFSPTGFLDDSEWHRTYWTFSRGWFSGWSGYFRTGQFNPSGRIMTVGDGKVYGFGREPQFYKWTTPIEYRLFRADKEPVILAQGGNRKNSPARYEGKTIADAPMMFTTDWSHRIPIYVRAMVLAGNQKDGSLLMVAGPPDMVDEEEAALAIGNPATRKGLQELDASLRGKRGAKLYLVDTANGSPVSRFDLPSPPVWDGMSAASGEVFLSDESGAITCFSAE